LAAPTRSTSDPALTRGRSRSNRRHTPTRSEAGATQPASSTKTAPPTRRCDRQQRDSAGSGSRTFRATIARSRWGRIAEDLQWDDAPTILNPECGSCSLLDRSVQLGYRSERDVRPHRHPARALAPAPRVDDEHLGLTRDFVRTANERNRAT